MFETDYPHPTSLYPGVQERLVEAVGHDDYETRKRILERNAAELFNLDARRQRLRWGCDHRLAWAAVGPDDRSPDPF